MAQRIQLLSFEEKVRAVERFHLETLFFCPDPWALRHKFVNEATGETIGARCDRWTCLYCGPRKVDLWRRLVAEAQPTLHVVLTRVGWTVQDASRVLTTVLQYLRRGTKGRGRELIGARQAYPVECFAVLEEHKNFHKVGFHWHLLVNGVEHLPHQVVSDALRSSMSSRYAEQDRSYIVRVRGVTNTRAIGYVTKYLTKEVAKERRGTRLVEQQHMVYRRDGQGKITQATTTRMVEAMSHARRIRYTRHFFPESTAALRIKVFADLGDGEIALSAGGVVPDVDETQEEEQESVKASWVLFEEAPYSDDTDDYHDRRHKAVRESIQRQEEGERLYSGRIVGMWAAQRRLQRAEWSSMTSHTGSEG